MSVVVCHNPYCGRKYPFAPLSFESSMVEKVVDVSKNTCCQAPTIKYFCPDDTESKERLERIRKQLLELRRKCPERSKEIDTRISKLHTYAQSGRLTSCRDRYKEYQSKFGEAMELLKQRRLYARFHTIRSERDFPEDMRLESNPHLLDLLYDKPCSSDTESCTYSVEYDVE